MTDVSARPSGPRRPKKIEKIVPSATIGIVFLIAGQSSFQTVSWVRTDRPRFPWARSAM